MTIEDRKKVPIK